MEPFVFRSADESMNVSYWNDVKPSEGNGLSSGNKLPLKAEFRMRGGFCSIQGV